MIAIIGALIYKVVLLACGFGLSYLGYRLFIAGIYAPSGDLDARFGKSTLILKQASPGIFFAFFGTTIILAAAWKGLTLEEGTPHASAFDSTPITIGLIVTDDDRLVALQMMKSLNDGHQLDESYKESALNLLDRVSIHQKIDLTQGTPALQSEIVGRGIASQRDDGGNSFD